MPLELDNMEPEMDQNPEMSPEAGEVIGLEPGETDHEGAMAKADLLKLASYASKLGQTIQDDDQLESWVQAKITKAADYIASVYHYLEYEMKFSDYGKALDDSDVLSESQKRVLKFRLNEAKEKMKDLKKAQAEKVKVKKVEEATLIGKEKPCEECNGTGRVYEEPTPVPAHVKKMAGDYNRKAMAFHAASKRLDKNQNGIPDNEESVEEEFTDKSKVGDTFKTRTGTATKTSTGVMHKNTSYADDGEAEQKSGKGVKSHAKSQSASEKKEKAPAQKMSPKSAKTWGMKDNEKFDNRDKEVDEMFGQGVYEAKAKKDYDGDGKVESDKDEVWGSRAKAAAKAGKPFKETAEKTSERDIEMKKQGGGTVKVKATQYKGHQSKAADKASKDKDLDEAKAHAKDCDCNECMMQEGDFKNLEKKLSHQKGVTNPAGLAAKIGRDKYGKAGMEKKAAAGRKKADESFKHNVRFVNESIEFLLAEDEEGKAKAITAAGDIVNDYTSWMQRVGQYQTKSMIELADAIRADFGAAEAEAFKNAVAPALSQTLEVLTQQREAVSNAVAVLAGEATPEEPMGMDPSADVGIAPEPGLDATAPDDMNPEPGADLGDEFGASDAGSSNREMRESKQETRARKLAESHSLIAKLAK
jgi:hypothetical protein